MLLALRPSLMDMVLSWLATRTTDISIGGRKVQADRHRTRFSMYPAQLDSAPRLRRPCLARVSQLHISAAASCAQQKQPPSAFDKEVEIETGLPRSEAGYSAAHAAMCLSCCQGSTAAAQSIRVLVLLPFTRCLPCPCRKLNYFSHYGEAGRAFQGWDAPLAGSLLLSSGGRQTGDETPSYWRMTVC